MKHGKHGNQSYGLGHNVGGGKSGGVYTEGKFETAYGLDTGDYVGGPEEMGRSLASGPSGVAGGYSSTHKGKSKA